MEEVRHRLSLPLEESEDADTISGLLMDVKQKILVQGDKLQVEGATAEVLEMKNDSATKLRFKIDEIGS